MEQKFRIATHATQNYLCSWRKKIFVEKIIPTAYWTHVKLSQWEEKINLSSMKWNHHTTLVSVRAIKILLWALFLCLGFIFCWKQSKRQFWGHNHSCWVLPNWKISLLFLKKFFQICLFLFSQQFIECKLMYFLI